MEPSSLPTMVMADYDLYRLDDYIFWGLMVLALLICLVHAARRAFRQPVPTDSGKE